ncbi:MAG: glycosyltransferase [Deltaproteobacteria bacterium]|nr:glycosyltransferase [Deltaproteobacteria bacterium]MBW2130869.1 glycosyltransferase [Deltaproteobacteria bacterium]
MNDTFKVSLIITTYNWPGALRRTLQSALSQSRPPDEIIVADDGSDEETAETVMEVLGPTSTIWRHVRHADLGVRQSRIKNLAVKNSQGSYLVFVDHDVVLHPDFVRDHVSMAREGTFLQGKRAFLPREHTKRVIEEGFSPPRTWSGGIGNRKNAVRLPILGRLLAREKGFQTILRGCNLSMFRKDFLRVDGFDEVFDRSWGREDSDICYRLFHSGIKIRNLWFLALQYHLEHEVVTRWEKERLDRELKRNIDEKRTFAIHGFSKLSDEGGVVAGSDMGRDPEDGGKEP